MSPTKFLPFILVSLAIVATLLIGFYIGVERGSLKKNPINSFPPKDDEVFCTMDAKMCPDGSYVGRVGPSCEFAPCPSM